MVGVWKRRVFSVSLFVNFNLRENETMNKKFEKWFNMLVELLLAGQGWLYRLIRLPLGWHGTILDGNGVNVVFWYIRSDGQIMVLLGYSPIYKSWGLIGGGVKNKETFDPEKGDFFLSALIREIKEEIHRDIHPYKIFEVAVFQQLKSIAGCWITTGLWLYSVALQEDEVQRSWMSEHLTLQNGELTKVEWVPIEEAIQGSKSRKIGLSYRRMLLKFLHQYYQKKSGQRISNYQGCMAHELSFRCGQDTFIV